jgi:hypothetical protein
MIYSLYRHRSTKALGARFRGFDSAKGGKTMSYMANDMMLPVTGIQELSLEEIDEVGGAWILAAIVVVVVVAGAYYAGRSQGDC